MRLLILYSLFASFTASSQVQNLFYNCTFESTENNRFILDAYFSGAGNNCFEDQIRSEYVSGDTLFMNNLYLFPYVFDAFGCNRKDTLSQSMFPANVNYINVSAGVVVFNSNSNQHDTIPNMFEQTFLYDLSTITPQSSFFHWDCSNEYLTVTGNSIIDFLEVLGTNGELLLRKEGNKLNVSTISTGIYFVRLYSENSTAVLRWYKD